MENNDVILLQKENALNKRILESLISANEEMRDKNAFLVSVIQSKWDSYSISQKEMLTKMLGITASETVNGTTTHTYAVSETVKGTTEHNYSVNGKVNGTTDVDRGIAEKVNGITDNGSPSSEKGDTVKSSDSNVQKTVKKRREGAIKGRQAQ